MQRSVSKKGERRKRPISEVSPGAFGFLGNSNHIACHNSTILPYSGLPHIYALSAFSWLPRENKHLDSGPAELLGVQPVCIRPYPTKPGEISRLLKRIYEGYNKAGFP